MAWGTLMSSLTDPGCLLAVPQTMNELTSDRIARILENLAGTSDARLPTSTLTRLRLLAGAGAHTSLGALTSWMRGLSGIDPETIERLVLSLGELKGIAMKIGQILSYVDDSLPSETRQLLAVLQRSSQPTPFTEVQRILTEDFGPAAESLLAHLEPAPVAVASVGQVHRARLTDGTVVAVKVRHPGIEVAMRADLRSAQMGKALARLLAPGIDIGALVAEAQAAFLEECDYVLERQRQERFEGLYASDPDIIIPHVYPVWCSRRVLTTTWHEGARFEAFARATSQTARDRAGQALYRFYVGAVYGHRLFNGDPHPGNLLFHDDGRVVILDHGCVRTFDSSAVAGLVDLSRAVQADDMGAMSRALTRLGARPPKPGAPFEATRTLLRSFYAPILESGKHRVVLKPGLAAGLLANKRSLLQLRLPGRLLFLFRIRFGLQAVLSTLGAEADWRGLEAELLSLG